MYGLADSVDDILRCAHNAAPGLERLRAICYGCVSHLAGDLGRPAAATESPNVVALWEEILKQEVRVAVGTGEMPASTDPDDVAFALHSLALGLDQAVRLRQDEAAARRALTLMTRVIAV